jgi:cytosine/adenosine deaminase-related metal-dependent hydrolase
MDSSSPWHTDSEKIAEEMLARQALDIAKRAIKHGTHHQMHEVELFAWEDGSIAPIAEKMDESRKKLGPIPVSTASLVHEGRSQE